MTLAGNTTMTQLLLKVEPRYIRRSPYVPAASNLSPHQAPAIWASIVDDHVTALVYPQVSSYVGGRHRCRGDGVRDVPAPTS
jgi:hypothetical protein